ncbi:MAG: GNAT family N-acetyltransferase [Pseudomonadales bacterium]|nr:GNAT family N-acetyltransferase [Pseudomonadales bacterium]
MNTDVLKQQANDSTSTSQSNENSVDELEIRFANKDDLGNIAELMYSSGADLYDYIYNTANRHALEYIQMEFLSNRGLCSHKLLTVAILDGKVVGTGTFWDRDGYKAMSSGSTLNMIRFYGLRVLPRMLRAVDSMKLMKPPKHDELYLANFGVDPALRGCGIGSKLLNHKIEQARADGYRMVSLDVSTKNPKAEALYQRLGFAVTDVKSMTGRDGNEYACKKMELFL